MHFKSLACFNRDAARCRFIPEEYNMTSVLLVLHFCKSRPSAEDVIRRWGRKPIYLLEDVWAPVSEFPARLIEPSLWRSFFLCSRDLFNNRIVLHRKKKGEAIHAKRQLSNLNAMKAMKASEGASYSWISSIVTIIEDKGIYRKTSLTKEKLKST